MLFGFINAVFMGAGAKVWNANALWAGFFTAILIIPVFWFRHHYQDGGKFPDHMYEDLNISPGEMVERKAGILPYLVLVAGLATVLLANWFFVLPA